MPSPFPGVDPYLESQHYWRDFHARFTTYLCDALNDLLPGHYDARIDERVQLVDVESSRTTHEFLPDVALVRHGEVLDEPRAGAGVLIDTGTVTVPLAYLDEEREAYLKIFRLPERTLVAVIELLSPTNKVEPGYGEYLVKRDALLRQPVHLIKFDFLTRGQRVRLAGALPTGDYYAMVARGDRRPDCSVSAWSVRGALPKVEVPLLRPDPDLVLDLASVYSTAYERGRYARSINYGAPLTVPLAPADLAWAEGLARGARR